MRYDDPFLFLSTDLWYGDKTNDIILKTWMRFMVLEKTFGKSIKRSCKKIGLSHKQV